MPKPRKNSWTREINREASTVSAMGMFGLFMVGQLVLIVASITALGGLLTVGGAFGSEWTTRLVGSGVVLVAFAGLYFGAWASREYAVQRGS